MSPGAANGHSYSGERQFLEIISEYRSEENKGDKRKAALHHHEGNLAFDLRPLNRSGRGRFWLGHFFAGIKGHHNYIDRREYAQGYQGQPGLAPQILEHTVGHKQDG